jgi:hypothetical protein
MFVCEERKRHILEFIRNTYPFNSCSTTWYSRVATTARRILSAVKHWILYAALEFFLQSSIAVSSSLSGSTTFLATDYRIQDIFIEPGFAFGTFIHGLLSNCERTSHFGHCIGSSGSNNTEPDGVKVLRCRSKPLAIL